MNPIAPRVVSDGSLLENVQTGEQVDATVFPTPRWHEQDEGRYIGAACCVITGDPPTPEILPTAGLSSMPVALTPGLTVFPQSIP